MKMVEKRFYSLLFFFLLQITRSPVYGCQLISNKHSSTKLWFISRHLIETSEKKWQFFRTFYAHLQHCALFAQRSIISSKNGVCTCKSKWRNYTLSSVCTHIDFLIGKHTIFAVNSVWWLVYYVRKCVRHQRFFSLCFVVSLGNCDFIKSKTERFHFRWIAF